MANQKKKLSKLIYKKPLNPNKRLKKKTEKFLIKL